MSVPGNRVFENRIINKRRILYRLPAVLLVCCMLFAGCGCRKEKDPDAASRENGTAKVVEKIPDSEMILAGYPPAGGAATADGAVRAHALYPLIDRCFYESCERISEKAADGGFEIRFRNTASDPDVVHTLTVEEIGPLPEFDSEEECRDHFEKLFPELKSFSAYEGSRQVLTEDRSVLYF